MLKRFKRDKELKMLRTLICMNDVRCDADVFWLKQILRSIERINKEDINNPYTIQYLSDGNVVIRCMATEKKYNKIANAFGNDENTKHLAVWNYQIA